MSNLAIIPARGGSKRIPRKNIKQFLGKPIIAYSIEAAIRSELFEEVMVSTDDEEIAEIAIKFGAKVPFIRSKNNSDDFTTVSDVIVEVLNTYFNKYQKQFEAFVCIYPTAPLIQINHLKRGIELLKNPLIETVFPVVSFSYPIWRGLFRDDNGYARLVWPEYLNSRSQDLTTVYHDAGQWYAVKSTAFLASKKILTDLSTTILLEEREVQDIDSLKDWELAELKYKLLNN